MPKTHWIMVAGTGQPSGLPSQTVWLAKAIGKALAEASFGLVVGGWHGVDYIAAEAFEQSLTNCRPGVPLSDLLIQVLPQSRDYPEFRGGRVVHVERGPPEWVEAVRFADAVVLLGGEGGTYETYLYALQERRAVFPVRASGGDAAKVYETVRRLWPASGIWGIGQAAFSKTLERSVESWDDARELTDGLMTLLVDHISVYDSERRRNGLFLSYAREDSNWLDVIKSHLTSVPAHMWHDGDIPPGDTYDRQIHAALRNSIAAVLLVTPDFLSSDYVRTVELPYLLRASSAGHCRLFWIHLRRANYEAAPLEPLQAVISPERPLEELSPSEQQTALAIASHRITQFLRETLGTGPTA